MRNFSMQNLVIKNKGHELDEYAAGILDNEEYLLIGNEGEVEEFCKRIGSKINIKAILLDGSSKNIFLGKNVITIKEADAYKKIICLSKNRQRYSFFLDYFKNRGGGMLKT